MPKDPEMHIYPDPDYETAQPTTETQETDAQTDAGKTAASPESPGSSQ